MNDQHVAQWIANEGVRQTDVLWWGDQATLNRYNVGNNYATDPVQSEYPFLPHLRPCGCQYHKDWT